MKLSEHRSWEVEFVGETVRGYWDSVRKQWCNHTSESAGVHLRAGLEQLKVLDEIRMQMVREKVLRVGKPMEWAQMERAQMASTKR